jgi:hypothetical protein
MTSRARDKGEQMKGREGRGEREGKERRRCVGKRVGREVRANGINGRLGREGLGWERR